MVQCTLYFDPHRGHGTPLTTRSCFTDVYSVNTERVVSVECRQSNSGSGCGVVKHQKSEATVQCVGEIVTSSSWLLPVDDSGPIHRVSIVVLTHSII